jgi:hypothetical protein
MIPREQLGNLGGDMTSFFTTIVDLAKLGNLGVGVAILLMGFMLAFQTKPVDSATAKLRGNFLKFGFAYAVFTALIGLAPLLVHGGPLSERLAFSPDFDSEKLQPPIIRLPDGTQAGHDAKFSLDPSADTQVVTIAMDATLDQVRNLRQASAVLTSAVTTVTKQRDSLAAQAAAKPMSDTQSTPALQNLQQSSNASNAIQTDFVRSLKVGDYKGANQLAERLQTSLKAAQPAVATLVRPASR